MINWIDLTRDLPEKVRTDPFVYMVIQTIRMNNAGEELQKYVNKMNYSLENKEES